MSDSHIVYMLLAVLALSSTADLLRRIVDNKARFIDYALPIGWSISIGLRLLTQCLLALK